jgi:hypothetical protein
VLWTFPFVWLVLALPFLSAALIGRVRPLRTLAGTRHPFTWIVGLIGLCAFLAGFVGLLPAASTGAAVMLGGALSGFVCFWPGRPDDGEDWRRWSVAPDDGRPPPGLPDIPIDWHEFDHLRAGWSRGGRVTP